jgi:hypothetical protein
MVEMGGNKKVSAVIPCLSPWLTPVGPSAEDSSVYPMGYLAGELQQHCIFLSIQPMSIIIWAAAAIVHRHPWAAVLSAGPPEQLSFCLSSHRGPPAAVGVMAGLAARASGMWS